MNPLDYLSFLQSALKIAPLIKDIIDQSGTNEGIVERVKHIAPSLAQILSEIGQAFFPKVAPQISIAAGVIAAFDPSVTKWVQGACNVLLSPPPGLVVDGLYGPKTRAAVEQLQAKLGLKVDGFAGQITQAAISAALGGTTKIAALPALSA